MYEYFRFEKTNLGPVSTGLDLVIKTKEKERWKSVASETRIILDKRKLSDLYCGPSVSGRPLLESYHNLTERYK